MGVPPVDDKSSDTLVAAPGEGSWTGSSTLPHLHHIPLTYRILADSGVYTEADDDLHERLVWQPCGSNMARDAHRPRYSMTLRIRAQRPEDRVAVRDVLAHAFADHG